MRLTRIIAPALALAATLTACQNDMSSIGGSISKNEVTIVVDSLELNIASHSVYVENGDGRNLTKLIGRISVPEYGSLECSFVSQMLSAESMSIPDSITEAEVDSMRLVLSVPRGQLTGDSLAPQQLRVYRLTKQLPAGIGTEFDPTGYYDESSLMGSRSYTLSNIAKGDSAMKRDAFVRIPVQMPREFALDLFRRYRANDPIFQWPATFNAWFPGIYVTQNFGNGCIANVSKAEMFTYWHRTKQVSEKQEEGTYAMVNKIVRDSVCLLASQPEVLSSNILNFKISDYISDLVADGKTVITTPCGYIANIEFPAQYVLNKYMEHGDRMSVVAALKMDIPATAITNDYGLSVAPYLLMIKTSEREQFFAKNKLPDGENSFYAAYDSTDGCYKFNSLRTYFLNLLAKVRRGETIEKEDVEFSLVPVYIETETVSGYSSSTVYVTKVQPYLFKPTMTQLHTDRAVICFTYSAEEME